MWNLSGFMSTDEVFLSHDSVQLAAAMSWVGCCWDRHLFSVDLCKSSLTHQHASLLSQPFFQFRDQKMSRVIFISQVPGLSTSSSTTPTSSSSTSQDSVFDVNRYTDNPAPERSGSTSEELQGNPLHKPTETENKNKNEGPKKYKAIYCMTCARLSAGFQRKFGRWK